VTRRAPFKQIDVTRALKGAVAGGFHPNQVEINPDGVIVLKNVAADQGRLARQALAMQIRSEGEQDLSNLPTRLDKSEGK
jgi:hypothetical protein